MRKFSTFFTIVLLLSTQAQSAEHLSGSKAEAKISGTAELWYKSDQEIPSYIRFRSDFQVNEIQLFTWLRAQFDLPVGLQFVHHKTAIGQTGITHKFYDLQYNNLPLAFYRIAIHLKDGFVHSFNGNLFSSVQVLNNQQIQESVALSAAISAVGAMEYKWQFQEEEQWLKEHTGDQNATFYPKGEKCYLAQRTDRGLELRQVYRFDIYAHRPNTREHVYVDAATGAVVMRNSRMKHFDSIGTAHTGYSGIRQINTSLSGGKYVLRESSRGDGINTYNMQRSYFFSNAIDFKDNDNVWENPVNLDKYATDAHWGAEMTYDYFKLLFNRNSIDNNGAELNSYVHWGESEPQAKWDGYRVLFGDGPSATLPFTTVDITAHEFTHGLIDHTADFMYLNESGALCESFADIFGNCVEHFGKPNEFSWRIGDDRGSYSTDMSNPNLMADPDTYHGTYWYTGTNDNGGVHTNSGVHNFWFYLLTEGGNGMNDLDNLYEVHGIGINNAAAIAYENLTGYLTPNSDYEEARAFSILIAEDMFGVCSPQHTAVVNAWHAVGIGDKLVPEALADFTADRQRFCNPPFTVRFENKSNYDFSFVWDFGDGTTDSLNQHPAHTYTKPGRYTVKLTVDGDYCGEDERLQYDYIDGTLIEKPIGRSVTSYEGEVVALSASTVNGEVHWYADPEGEHWLYSGNTFQTPALFENKTYFVRSVVTGAVHTVGESLDQPSGNGNFSGEEKGLIFDVYQDVVIKSVFMHSNLGGSHKIQIRKADMSVIFETNLLLEPGAQEVTLNAEVPAGTDYCILLTGLGGNLWVERNAAYPYDVNGAVMIKRGSGKLGSDYPYFFDWNVKELDCLSEPQEINVSVSFSGTSKFLYNEIYSKNEMLNGRFQYYIKLDVPQGSNVSYGLYNISGQKMLEYTDNEVRIREETNLNQLLNLDNYTGGVYFISVKGIGLDMSKRIILQSGTN